MSLRFELTIGRKIYGIIAICLVGGMGVVYQNARELSAALEQQKRIELVHLVETAMVIARVEQAAAQSGAITVDAAKARAAKRIGASR